jgi:hypothetical protein
MKNPHKHAEVIKAWADGAEIQSRRRNNDEWCDTPSPSWYKDTEYRIKQEPKPDHVYYGVFEMNGSMLLESCFTKVKDDGDELKLTFDGETGKLKSAEVIE